MKRRVCKNMGKRKKIKMSPRMNDQKKKKKMDNAKRQSDKKKEKKSGTVEESPRPRPKASYS